MRDTQKYSDVCKCDINFDAKLKYLHNVKYA